MATKLFLKQFQNSFTTSTTYRYASLTASVLAFITAVTNKVNGVTQDTVTAGGGVIAWISPPLSAAVTISGTITYNAWVLTSIVTGAPKTVGRVYKYSNGVETQISTATSALVQSTSAQVDNFTDPAPTSTTFAAGDRIVIKFWVSSSSATGTETLDYGGLTASADGDTWVQFTESISFQSEAEFIQSANGATSALTLSYAFPGVSAAGNLIIINTDVDDQSKTLTFSDSKLNPYTVLYGPSNWNGSTSRNYAAYAHNIIGGGSVITVTTTASSGSPAMFSIAVEYGGISPSPLDVVTSPTTGVGTLILTPNGFTNFPNELIVGMGNQTGGLTGFLPFVRRPITGNGVLADMSVTRQDSYNYNLTQVSAPWSFIMATFKWGTQPFKKLTRGPDRPLSDSQKRYV